MLGKSSFKRVFFNKKLFSRLTKDIIKDYNAIYYNNYKTLEKILPKSGSEIKNFYDEENKDITALEKVI